MPIVPAMVEWRTQPWHWITDLFHTSSRKPEERKIGIEIERIGIWSDGSTLHYNDRSLRTGESRPGAGSFLRQLESQPGWAVIKNDQGYPLGFSTPLGKVSLEPGSQVELSTNPSVDLPELVENVEEFDRIVEKIAGPWGLKWIGLGVNPLESVNDMDVIPSTRYNIMTEYLGKRAKLGTSMMRLTTSVQVNLDYTSEEEAIEMLRVGLALTPISYALFGNSPLAQGKDTGYLSYRRMIWKETDPDRTGLLHSAFSNDFDFSKYAELIWKQPLMFAQNSKKGYVPANGQSLAMLSENKTPGVTADETNQFNAIREFFTEARLKPGYVEIRSIDGLRTSDRYAATAFWTGVLYSSDARKLALKLVGKISSAEREEATVAAARSGVKSQIAGREMKDIALELTTAARDGLKARGRKEEHFLDPIFENLRESTNPADKVLRQYQGPWQKNIKSLVDYSAS